MGQEGRPTEGKRARRGRHDLQTRKARHLLVPIWFAGRMIHESTKTPSKTLARDAERQRRRELEGKWNHVERRSLPPTFSSASLAWLEAEKPHLAERTYEIYEVAVRCHLSPRSDRV